MNLINTLFVKYDNLSPKHKAMVDMFGMLFIALFSSSIVATAIYFDLLMEVSILMVCYGLYGLIKTFYQFRVAHYEFQEKYSKK